MTRRSLCLLLVLFLAASTYAADWPQFRGPNYDGTTTAKGVPTEWGPEQNVKWKAPLPAGGNSSPIVEGDRVFVTCAEDDGQKRHLFCFDRATGEQLWVRTVAFDKVMPTHKTNPYAASSPAADGERVIVWHGSAGLYCYDYQGSEIWSKDLGEFRHVWGYASSPVLYKDAVILNAGPGKRSFLAAFDRASGEELWRTEEPMEGTGEKRDDGSWAGSWATPLIEQVDGRDQIICTLPTRVIGYDPASGEIIWYCEGIRGKRGDLAYSSPVVDGELCVAIGGFSGPSIGFKLGGKEDITESNRLWRKPQNPQSIGSGIALDGYAYVPWAGPGIIQCIEMKSGDLAWQDRAAGANHWGSIVMAEGNLFVTNQRGTTVVFKPNAETFELVAENKLNEQSNSTPAIADGQVFIRTYENLYCIE